MKKQLLFTFMLLVQAGLTVLHAQTVKVPFVLNGQVTASAQCGDTVYISGTFTRMGHPDSIGKYGTTVDLVTAKPKAGWPRPNESVDVAISDGQGGFYIGGTFTMVDNQPRSHIAHIDHTGTLTSKLDGISLNGSVSALDFKNDILYVGGSFTIAGDAGSANVTRNRAAAFNVNTNQLTSWDPNLNNLVSALVVGDATVYLGGAFTTAGGTPRTYFVPVSLATGAPEAWDPNANGQVSVLALAGDTLFAGGAFTSFSGQARSRIAAVKGTNLLAWNPDINNSVRAIAVDGNTVYAAGIFTTVGGVTRTNIAAIERGSGLPASWNPALQQSSAINSLAVSDQVVYAGGNFTTNKVIGGAVRNRIVALDATQDTLMALPWYPDIQDVYVQCLAFSGNKLFIGGPYTNMGSLVRTRLAAFNAATGVICDWNPEANASALNMATSREQNRVYISGSSLNLVSGVPVSKIAAIDMTTGVCNTTWLPAPNTDPKAILPVGNLVYIGGAFTTISGVARNRIAALDTASGAPTSWNPNASGQVSALLAKGDTIYAGGSFTTIGGISRRYLAALDATTGTALSWNPNPSGGTTSINSMVRRDNVLYVGGAFTTIGGQSRNRIAAVSLDDATALSWNPGVTNNIVNQLAITNNALYLGGTFTGVSATTRNYLAVLDATTGALASWSTGTTLPAGPNTITLASGKVFAGITASPYLYAFTEETALPVSFLSVNAVKQQDVVNVNWSTASEQNNSYFEVERSANTTGFTTVSNRITGAGTYAGESRYLFTDRTPFTGGESRVYYRIKQVDFNGRFSYSKTVQVSTVRDASGTSGFTVYPNPGKRMFTIDFAGTAGEKTISIYDLQGRLLHTLTSTKDFENLQLDYQAGVYLVQVKMQEQASTSRLVITE